MSQSGIYSELKPAWWFLRDGKLPNAPKQVQLILSDLCNQDCHFCAYRMSGYTSNELFLGDSEPAKYGHSNPVRWIPTERALSLLDELKAAGVLSVQFTGGGEPTVHPDHEAIFQKTLDIGLRASLVSNGLRWSDTLIESILPHFDWVRVSIDAGDADTYAAIRNTPRENFSKVWNHVERLAEAIEISGSKTTLGVGFVVTPESYLQIYKFALMAWQSGAQNVRFTAMFSPADNDPLEPIYDDATKLIEMAKALSGRFFQVYDNFGSRVSDLRQHAPDYQFCSYQYFTSYIGGDLKAYRCCVLAYNKRGLIAGGDLKERSFQAFWNSQERQADLKDLDARGCERCQFNTKNRAMNYLLHPNPDHKEWP